MPINMTCFWCEKDFTITPSRFKKNYEHYFCDLECYNNYVESSKNLNMECPICGKKFHRRR